MKRPSHLRLVGGAAPIGLPQAAVHARRGLTLSQELTFAKVGFRVRVRDSLVNPGGKRWTSNASFAGVRIEAHSDGRWSITPKRGAAQRGDEFVSLAACLYALPKGVAAVSFIEAALCVHLDAEAAHEIAAVFERWYARGAPAGAGRRL